MLVQFQNLLEEDRSDICYGILNGDQTVSCLCGCDGNFEPQDYRIIHTYPNADIGAVIQKHQNKEDLITLRNSLCADFAYELNNVDFSDAHAMDDSFQYMSDQLKMQYRDRKKNDFSISNEEYSELWNILKKESGEVQECYFHILDLLTK